MTDRSEPHRILVLLNGSDFATTALPYVRTLVTPDTWMLLLRVITPLPMIEVGGAFLLRVKPGAMIDRPPPSTVAAARSRVPALPQRTMPWRRPAEA